VSGVHDLGGAPGHGPIGPEPDEPVFHHEWERRTFALTLAAGFLGKWNLDMSRHARERMAAAEYLATSYYEHWLFGLERLLARTGLVRPRELEARVRDPRSPHREVPRKGLRVVRAREVARMLRDTPGARVEGRIRPRFRPGDRVRALPLDPPGHTRLPRYCRGKRGTVEIDQGVWIFPDAHAMGRGRRPQHVYSVRFAARELWGPGASERDSVHVDLWDDYLEPA
jgi:nitrile hydratase